MIGIFDSGVGGLTILSKIRELLVETPLVYVADHAYAPYGDLTHENVTDRSIAITQWLIDKGCSLVVVACNTATAISVDALRRQFDVPIVGVEPGVKPAAINSITQRIGILATENTVASQRYQCLLERYLPDVEIISQGCGGLADAIEKKSPDIDHLLKKYCEPLIEKNVDQIVLGCTHYPLVKDRLKQIAGENISVIDTSEAIAQEVKRRLYVGVDAVSSVSIRLHTTGATPQLVDVVKAYKSLDGLRDVTVTQCLI